MIHNFEINNFKSIEHLKVNNCRRVNIFIGEPGTGKTNLLEALGLFCLQYSIIKGDKTHKWHSIIRPGPTIGLFHYDEKNFADVIKIIINEMHTCTITRETKDWNWKQNQPNAEPLNIIYYPDIAPFVYNVYCEEHHKKAIEILKNTGLYDKRKSLSESQKLYITALLWCEIIKKDETIIYEEENLFLYPPYAKQLAETIALSRQGQFFIATHNNAFLYPLVEKTPMIDLVIYLVYLKNNKTHIKEMSGKQIEEILTSDIFFNLEPE